MIVELQPADLSSKAFADIVERHTNFCDGTAPAESCHRLPLSELAADDVTVWQASYNGDIVGMGALKVLGEHDGEVKSMHTFTAQRGLGVGSQILEKIIETARRRHYHALWLETGVHPDFSVARRLYAKNGFVETGPFGNYQEDAHSVFMTLDLARKAASQ